MTYHSGPTIVSVQEADSGLGKRSRKRKRFADEEPEVGTLKKRAVVQISPMKVH